MYIYGVRANTSVTVAAGATQKHATPHNAARRDTVQDSSRGKPGGRGDESSAPPLVHCMQKSCFSDL